MAWASCFICWWERLYVHLTKPTRMHVHNSGHWSAHTQPGIWDVPMLYGHGNEQFTDLSCWGKKWRDNMLNSGIVLLLVLVLICRVSMIIGIIVNMNFVLFCLSFWLLLVYDLCLIVVIHTLLSSSRVFSLFKTTLPCIDSRLKNKIQINY